MNKKIAIISAVTLGVTCLAVGAIVGTNNQLLTSTRGNAGSELTIEFTADNVVPELTDISDYQADFYLSAKPYYDKTHDYDIVCRVSNDQVKTITVGGSSIFSVTSDYFWGFNFFGTLDNVGNGFSKVNFTGTYVDTDSSVKNIYITNDRNSSEVTFSYDSATDHTQFDVYETSYTTDTTNITINKITVYYYCYQ